MKATRDLMKDEALAALHQDNNLAKRLESWMRCRHGVEQDWPKVKVLLEYVIMDASDFSPLLTDVVTALVARLDWFEHRTQEMEQEAGAMIRQLREAGLTPGDRYEPK